MVKELNSVVETLRSRVQVLYNMVEELCLRAYNTVRMRALVLHPLRELSNSLHSETWFPNGSLDRDDTMCGACTIVHMTKVGQLQSRVGRLYRRLNSTVRTMALVLRLLRKFSKASMRKSAFLITIQTTTIQCMGHGLSSL